MTDPVSHELSDKTRTFLLGHPRLKYPDALAAKHPHILNRIVELHKSTLELRDYFNSLTNNDRGERKGFSFEVLIDIQDLREVLLGDVNGYDVSEVNRWV